MDSRSRFYLYTQAFVTVSSVILAILIPIQFTALMAVVAAVVLFAMAYLLTSEEHYE